jgi:3-phytase
MIKLEFFSKIVRRPVLRRAYSQVRRVPVPVLAVLGVAGIGTLFFAASRAAGPFISLESEGGTLTGAVSKISDTSASGGMSVKFGAGSSVSQVPSPALPTVETPAYSGYSGDIADDSVIWPNPTNPAASVVIGDNKDANGGVGVFNMQGQQKQFKQGGKIGNIDLRSGMMLGGQSTVVVGANNRANNTMSFWALDPATQLLSDQITARSLTTSTGGENYGFCMYKSASSGKYYAFVTPIDAGNIQQWELFDSGGKIDARLVRSLPVPSITESCAADDELGYLYVSVEDVAFYRYGAEPTAGTTRTTIGTAGDGKLVADIEGVGIAKGPNNTGYVVVSSQGNSTYQIYDRQTNVWQRSFSVPSNGTIDASTGTDGLDISTENLGPGFEHGVLVVHDEANSGGTTSNLKYVPLVAGSGTVTPVPPPSPAPAPAGVPGSWNLKFSDEFDGTALDLDKWDTQEGWNNSGVTVKSSNVRVSGGNVILTLQPDGTSGAIVSTLWDDPAGPNSYLFPVGDYVEFRAYFPGDDATQPIYNWPAVWTSGPDWPAAGEHDVAEGLGGDLTVNYHYGTSSATHQALNMGAPAGDWNNAFHTYGVHRKAASADVYWDGKLVKSYATQDNGLPHSVIVLLGKSGSRAPVTGTVGEVKVDYIRAWTPQ